MPLQVIRRVNKLRERGTAADKRAAKALMDKWSLQDTEEVRAIRSLAQVLLGQQRWQVLCDAWLLSEETSGLRRMAPELTALLWMCSRPSQDLPTQTAFS